jgi:hypothetical protein
VKRKVASFSALARGSMLAASVAKTRAKTTSVVSLVLVRDYYWILDVRELGGATSTARTFTPPFAGAYEWFYVPWRAVQERRLNDGRPRADGFVATKRDSMSSDVVE